MKKIFAILTAIAITLTVVPVSLATDVPSAWAEQEVAEAMSRGFVPDELQSDYTANITRAEFAKVAIYYLASSQNLNVSDYMNIASRKPELWLSVGKEYPFTQGELYESFADTDDLFVCYAFALGVVNGRGDDIFDPDSPITRQEAAVMLLNTYRFYGMYANQEKAFLFRSGQVFSDSYMIDEWAIEPAAVMYQMGVMTGVSDDKWDPFGHYTRQQCFATFMRLYNYWEPITIYQMVTYEEAHERLFREFRGESRNYHAITELDCEDYSVYYCTQTGTTHGQSYSLWIVYRVGGMREILHAGQRLPSNSPYWNDFVLYDLTISEDESTLTFKRDFNDITYHYSVDLATGKLTGDY